MVKLPRYEAPPPPRLPERCFTFYNYNYKFYFSRPPTRLEELEQMVDTAAMVTAICARSACLGSRELCAKRYSTIHKYTTMNLRHFLNMEFKFYCDECGTPHDQDEISAPER